MCFVADADVCAEALEKHLGHVSYKKGVVFIENTFAVKGLMPKTIRKDMNLARLGCALRLRNWYGNHGVMEIWEDMVEDAANEEEKGEMHMEI